MMTIDEIFEQLAENSILFDADIISKDEYNRRVWSMYNDLVRDDRLDDAELLLDELNHDDVIDTIRTEFLDI